jgi:hypothetical protein
MVNVYTGMPLRISNYGTASAARWQVDGTGGFAGASGGSVGSTGLFTEIVAKTGYTVFTHGTSLVYAVASDGTFIIVRLEIFDDDELVAVSDVNGNVEHMRIDGAAIPIIDPDGYVFYKYMVDRRVSVSPAGSAVGWAAGTLVNGLTTKGYIVADNRDGATKSPSISGIAFNGSQTDETIFRLGNLNGVIGETTDKFGVAIGNLTTGDTYISYNAADERLKLKNTDLEIYDFWDIEVARVYGANTDERLAGDFDFGRATGLRTSLFGMTDTWGVYRDGSVVLEVTPEGSKLVDLFTIGNFNGSRVELGQVDNRFLIAGRNRFGVVKALISSNDEEDVYVHFGNPEPQENRMTFDGSTGKLLVNGDVEVQGGSVIGDLSISSTGTITMLDPEEPRQYYKITSRGSYGYAIDALGAQYLSSVVASGRLMLETRVGSGNYKTYLAGTAMFGDADYRHFRTERGPTGRVGLFDGDNAVAYIDYTGTGYFTGIVNATGAEFSGDIVVSGGGRIITDSVVISNTGIDFDAIVGKFDGFGLRWSLAGAPKFRIGTMVDLGSVTGTIIESDSTDLTIAASNVYIMPSSGGEVVIGYNPSYGEASGNRTTIASDGSISTSGTATATFTNGIIGPSWKPASDGATAVKITNSAGTSILNFDTTNLLSTFRGNSTVTALGSELVINGAFATSSDWTYGANWAHDGTAFAAKHTAGSTATLSQAITLTNGAIYSVAFQIKTRTAGTVAVSLNGTAAGVNYNSSDTFAPVITAGSSGGLVFTPSSDFDGSIDNVSVKLVTPATNTLAIQDSSGTTQIEVRPLSGNLAFGKNSLRYLSVASAGNVAIGEGALQNNVTSIRNVAIGVSALSKMSVAATGLNVAIGGLALANNETGVANVGIGYGSLQTAKYSVNNVAIGSGALALHDGRNSDGNSGGNIAIGTQAAAVLTTGYNNVVIANQGAAALTTGNGNIAIGAGALAAAQTSANNVAIGQLAGYSATGNSSVFLGAYAGASMTSVSGAVAIGNFTGGRSTGSGNTLIGYLSGYGSYTAAGSMASSTMIGYESGRTAYASNAVYLGYQAGYYETAAAKLFVDNDKRSNEADGRIKALIYGEFNATMTSQLLRANGVFQSLMTDAQTNGITTQIKVSHNSTGSIDTGYGSRVLFELESSAAENRTAAAIDVAWTDHTDASRTSRATLSVVKSGSEVQVFNATGTELVVNDNQGNYDFRVEGDTSGYVLFVDASADALGVGTQTPASRLHVQVTDARTNDRANILTIEHSTTGTPITGFASGILFQLESDTSPSQDAAIIEAAWTNAAHGSRLGRISSIVYEQATPREAIRTEAVSGGSQVRIGDASGSNYTQFDSTGHVTFAGTAKPWQDMLIEPIARTTGVNAPTFEKWYDDAGGTSRGVYLYSFDDAVTASEKEVFFNMQMSHSWDGGDIQFHVHWVGAVNDTTATPRWGLEYIWREPGGTYSDTTIVYATGNHLSEADITAGKHYITSFTALSPGSTADDLSSVLIGRLFRNSGDAADTYNAVGAKCGLLYIDAHYQLARIGSNNEYTA